MRSTSPIASPTGPAARSRPKQIAYAISDVTHLRDVYVALSSNLQKRGRIDWVYEEMEVLTSPRHLSRRARARLGAPEDTRA